MAHEIKKQADHGEPVSLPSRKRLKAADKFMAALLSDCVVCGVCDESLTMGDLIEWDHVQPLALGGTNDKANMMPMHSDCHAQKTKADMTCIAKAKRQAGETGQRARRERKGRSSIPTKEDREQWIKRQADDR